MFEIHNQSMQDIFRFCKSLCSTEYGIADKFGNNLTFLKFLHTLKPQKNASQAEIVLSLLKNSNARVRSAYLSNLSNVGLSFTPQKSVSWILNITFLGKLVDIESAQLLFNANQNNESPELADTEIAQLPNRIIPAPLTQTVLTTGINHDSKLVVFTMARVLLKLLLNVKSWLYLKKVCDNLLLLLTRRTLQISNISDPLH